MLSATSTPGCWPAAIRTCKTTSPRALPRRILAPSVRPSVAGVVGVHQHGGASFALAAGWHFGETGIEEAAGGGGYQAERRVGARRPRCCPSGPAGPASSRGCRRARPVGSEMEPLVPGREAVQEMGGAERRHLRRSSVASRSSRVRIAGRRSVASMISIAVMSKPRCLAPRRMARPAGLRGWSGIRRAARSVWDRSGYGCGRRPGRCRRAP